MTPQEFKAWFSGFTEAMEGRPSTEQWTRIKKRVDEIDDKPITQEVWRAVSPPTKACLNTNPHIQPSFNSLGAMQALGHADADSLGMGQG